MPQHTPIGWLRYGANAYHGRRSPAAPPSGVRLAGALFPVISRPGHDLNNRQAATACSKAIISGAQSAQGEAEPLLDH